MNNQIHPADSDEQVIDLRACLQILMKRRVLIALITLLAVTAGAVLSFFIMQPVYEARTLLLVTQAAEKLQTSTQSRNPDDILSGVSNMPVMTMNTYVGQIKSEELMKRVVGSMGLESRGYTTSSLAGSIKASAAKDSYLLEVTVNNNDPQLAMDIANTLSEEFTAMLTERNREVMDRSVQFLQGQMEQARRELAAATTQAERDRLQGIITQLSEGITRTQIARSFDLGSTSVLVVSPAITAVKVKPNKQLNLAVAFLLGLMVSVALAFLLEFLDNTIKTQDDVARYLNLPVMGVIPRADSRRETYYGA